MTTTGDLGAAGNQNLARARARVHASHTFKQKHTSRQCRGTTISIRTQMSPSERTRRKWCACRDVHVRFFSARLHAYTHISARARQSWPSRRRRWWRMEKGGRIRATQRNNQCSLRVIIPLLDRFDCFKGVTRRSSGRAAARYIYLTIFLIILYTFAGRPARGGGPTAKEEVYRLKKSRRLATPVSSPAELCHTGLSVMTKNFIVHRLWRTWSRDRGWFIVNIYF